MQQAAAGREIEDNPQRQANQHGKAQRPAQRSQRYQAGLRHVAQSISAKKASARPFISVPVMALWEECVQRSCPAADISSAPDRAGVWTRTVTPVAIRLAGRAG